MITEAISRERLLINEKALSALWLTVTLLVFLRAVPYYDTAGDTGVIIREYVQSEIKEVREERIAAPFLREKKTKAAVNREKTHNAAADGVSFRRISKYIRGKAVKINVLKVDTKANPNLEIVPKQAQSKMHAKSGIRGFAKNKNAVAAINGTFFMPATGTPLGSLVIDGRIISGPVHERAAFLIGKNGFKTARVGFYGHLKTSFGQIKLDNINQPRMSKYDVIIYTGEWGAKSPSAKQRQMNAAISKGEIIAISEKPLSIPQNGYVVSGAPEKMRELKIGQKVSAVYGLSRLTPEVRHVISGGPYLLKQGGIFVDTTGEKLNAIEGKNPRSAIGYTKDGVFVAVVVEGRKEGSSGMTLNELAHLMKDLGCYEAINLDGGSSSAMYANGKTYGGTNLKGRAAVSNAIVVRKK